MQAFPKLRKDPSIPSLAAQLPAGEQEAPHTSVVDIYHHCPR